MGNALKFTSKGRVSVKVFPDLDTHHIILVVSDTGCGVPAAAMESIWNPFEQVCGQHGTPACVLGGCERPA